MSDTDRRQFLKKLAQGSIYAVPVVSTLLAPRLVGAQASQMMMMGGGGMMGGMTSGMTSGMMGGMAQQRNLPEAPWFRPPPGR